MFEGRVAKRVRAELKRRIDEAEKLFQARAEELEADKNRQLAGLEQQYEKDWNETVDRHREMLSTIEDQCVKEVLG